MKEETVFDASKDLENTPKGEAGAQESTLKTDLETVAVEDTSTQGKMPVGLKFYGQHTDERILYTVRPHRIVVGLQLAKAILGAVVVGAGFSLMATQLDFLGGALAGVGFVLAMVILVLGGWNALAGYAKNIAYITDRRVIKFFAETPFTVNSRSLNWEEAVKAKTYPPNFIWRMLKIGTLVIHARSTIVSTGEQSGMSKNVVADDDVELNDVYYYRDLGNYIDKILFVYRSKPDEVAVIKPFVAKPMGQRD